MKKSFVANGAIIDGEVDGCILSRNVSIGKNAVVKNCIILNGSKVCAGAHLENVIIDKDAHIEKKQNLLVEVNHFMLEKGMLFNENCFCDK